MRDPVFFNLERLFFRVDLFFLLKYNGFFFRFFNFLFILFRRFDSFSLQNLRHDDFYRNYFDAGKILIFSRNFCKQVTWINLAGALVFIIEIYYMGLSCFLFYVFNKNKLDFFGLKACPQLKYT